MAVGCGAKCAKFMLILFNIIFWLSGCAILAIGIWMLVDPSIVNVTDLFSLDTEDPMLKYASYVLIAMGAVVLVVGFLGCCGAIKESKCMLGLYIFFLLIIMAGELAAGILVLLYKDDIVSKATVTMEEKLKNDTIYASVEDDMVTFTTFGLAMSVAQVELKCCGISNITDYAGGAFEKEYGMAFPVTCCTMKEGTKIEDNMNINDQIENVEECMKMNEEYVNTQGCKDGLENAFSSNALILIGLGIGVACLELFGFIFAVCLCRNTGDDDE